MRLPNPLDLAARIAGPVAETLRSFADPGSPRRVWTADDQTHLEVRGVHRPGTEDAATDLRDRLIALDGVRAAEVNSVLGRVAVQHDSELVSGDELAEVVQTLESGGHTLEASLALWERGELLAAHCKQWLSTAREQLEGATDSAPE